VSDQSPTLNISDVYISIVASQCQNNYFHFCAIDVPSNSRFPSVNPLSVFGDLKFASVCATGV